MVVVRESPRSKPALDRNPAPAWPPASPLQALLSSPSGRKRWQDRRNVAEERTPSPSPMRKPLLKSPLLMGSSRRSDGEDDEQDDDDDDDEEEEEMLKLKLEKIEAQLKLKKLQKAKKRGLGIEDTDNEPLVPSKAGSASLDDKPAGVYNRESYVEVPISPRRDAIVQEPVSPARRRLGLESVKASSVSLKRARDGTQLSRSNSQRLQTGETHAIPKPSFSERLLLSREETHEQEVKQNRIAQSRSTSFSNFGPSNDNTALRKKPSSGHLSKSQNNSIASINTGAPVRSIGEPSALSNLAKEPAKRSLRDYGSGVFSNSATAPSLRKPQSTGAITTEQERKADDTASAGFDPFSQVHLSKRNHAHIDIARELADKEIYDLPRLLKEVVSPHYEPPQCETDFVVFAILASKSSPYDAKSSTQTSDSNKPQEDVNGPRNKFMVLHLTDLKWELDCFLFGSGFDQFWKLTPGTLLAVLNPAIMPPKTNQHNGCFSLKLASCDDKIMEIGVARDLGFCVSTKKDGKQCNAWVDKRHTDICEFHLNLMIDKNRKHRMEVNTMWRGNKDDDDRSKRLSRIVGSGDRASKRSGPRQNSTYHAEYGHLYSVPNVSIKSAASLLDAEDTDALHNMSREEASRKRIASAEKERSLAKRLGNMGNTVGSEYLRAKHGSSAPATTQESSTSGAASASAYHDMFEKPSAAELGLLNNKAADQHLSPAKNRKRHFGLGAISSTGTGAIGWGGARKAGILQPKDNKLGEPEKGQTKLQMGKRAANSFRERSLSPKKRARFALEQGIREPGRESLGEELRELKKALRKDCDANDRDDEDDLDIV